MKNDKLILIHLSKGKTQAEIAEIFKRDGIEPNSLSSIEKDLKRIKKEYGAKTMFHLACLSCPA